MTILEKIFVRKREEIEEAKSKISPVELGKQALSLPARRGFRNALRASSHQTALIAEVKKASPSMGVIREDFDPVAIGMAYERAGADCLSVLTDIDFFKGSPEYLRKLREAVQLPLLRKDFICDPYQLDEALVWGADAILLIVAGLDRSHLFDLHVQAIDRGLDVLVEVHDGEELDVALELGADLIGINNRDLRTFETRLETTEELAPRIPSGIVRVSESALNSLESVNRVGKVTDAVLIGTAFCESPYVETKVKEVMGW